MKSLLNDESDREGIASYFKIKLKLFPLSIINPFSAKNNPRDMPLNIYR